jgi:hypothetical protein
MAWEMQTMSRAFQEICAGEREWTALGNFMNYWYSYAKDGRYFARHRLSGFALNIMWIVQNGSMIRNIRWLNPGTII